MKLKIYEDSKNYTCQVIRLPELQSVVGLDNLMSVNIQGNDCLVGKDSQVGGLHLFFPAEAQICHDFLSKNNLYRNIELNSNKDKKGFFEDNRRVKAVKFKGVISSGFVIPLKSLVYIDSVFFADKQDYLKQGDEFNEINGIELCKKWIRPHERKQGMSNPKVKVLDNIVDSIFAPEHFDTSHLMKNTHKLRLDDYVAITYKLHGTSARYFNTLVKRPLNWKDRLAKRLGIMVVEDHYDYICGSRRVVKSCGFEELPDKNHFFKSGDLWSEVGKEVFEGKLNKGEAVYCEIIGKTYSGEAIQSGYTYGFEKPKVYIYRISNINPQGIELDLTYHQMIIRAKQLGVEVCPEFFYGTVREFLLKYVEVGSIDDESISKHLNDIFYNKLLEKKSIFDNAVFEEGFCIRIDRYGKPDVYKVKSKNFLLHEGKLNDKEVSNIEDEQASTTEDVFEPVTQ